MKERRKHMKLYEVRLTTLAAVMGVTPGWARGLVYQLVLDDIRENPSKGSPYIVGMEQVFQVVLAWRMRQAGIGYDTIRLVLDGFEIDKVSTHSVMLCPEISLALHRAKLRLRATQFFIEANKLEHGTEEEVAA